MVAFDRKEPSPENTNNGTENSCYGEIDLWR
jgi:hypothetical protein